jgi:hypothetical protein
MASTAPWSDPNRLARPRGQLTAMDADVERDLRRRLAQERKVYRACVAGEPWPEGVPHTDLFEACWQSGLDELAWRRMDVLNRQADRAVREAAKRAALARKRAELARRRRARAAWKVARWLAPKTARRVRRWVRVCRGRRPPTPRARPAATAHTDPCG